jgi:hypothetical protein
MVLGSRTQETLRTELSLKKTHLSRDLDYNTQDYMLDIF